MGAPAALRELIEQGSDALVASAGPRFFHFVVGGQTPAALGADWLTTVLDQCSFSWASSPLGVQLEVDALAWLRDLFGLPAGWGGIMTTGASQANFVGLAAARQWWAERYGVDVAERQVADDLRVESKTGAPRKQTVGWVRNAFLHGELALLPVGCRGQH